MVSAIARRFESIAALHSEREAVKSGARVLTYGDLERRAEELASRVRAHFGAAEGSVGLLLEHGVDLAVGALACLKAGRIHIPLDLNNPADRQAAILADARARLVLRMKSTPMPPMDGVGALVVDDPATDPLPSLATWLPDDPAVAFILYTSGSTGQPKGVMYRHDSVVARVADCNRFAVGPGDRITALGSGGMNMYRALLTGATLVALNLREVSVEGLPQWLADEHITVYHSVPTVLRRLMSSLPGRLDVPDLRLVNITGETMLSSDVEMFRELFPETCELVNGLGTTEAGTFCEFRIARSTSVMPGPVPVGYAIEGTGVLLLDQAGAVVADGEIGEIVVVGEHLAAGYWQQPLLTADRFSVTECDGSRTSKVVTRRTYRTGDLGRFLPDGSLLHLGREDFQVKIRGHRVEVGEVEVACRKHHAVREAVVIGRPDPSGVTSLHSYIVPQPAATIDPSELMTFLRDRLPEYMVPGTVAIIPALPVTPNGKVDRLALPDPVIACLTSAPTPLPPQGDLERVLLGFWREILKRENVSINDDFFALGGDSLSATQVVARIFSELNVEIPASTVFRAPTIVGLARKVEEFRA
jgi:amino acid adenylation domain-containing protein